MGIQELYNCLDPYHKYGYEIEYFWISGIVVTLIGVLGLIANILNLAVLFRPNFRKKSCYQLLITMALFDILFILSSVVHNGYYSMACITGYNEAVDHISYDFLKVGVSGSIYTIVMVSVERFLTMCCPLMSRRRNAWIYIIPIVLVAIGCNLPRFIEYEYHIVNGTIHSKKQTWYDEEYKIHYHLWTTIDTCADEGGN